MIQSKHHCRLQAKWLLALCPTICLVMWLTIGLSSSAIGQQTPTINDDLKKPEFSDSDIEFFENKIRPIFVVHCLECHGTDDKKVRGGLRLSSRSLAIAGGDSGPAIVPGKPEDSLLIHAVRYDEFEMPPKGKLSQQQIADLTTWIRRGAPDPRNPDSPAPEDRSIDVEAGKNYWAFRPRAKLQAPPVKENAWAESDVDRFILNRMEKEAIRPVPDANRETLIRRAYATLIGLPPSVKKIDNFINDPDDLPTAFNKVIDELLESPHFGERWGRHWLDVVRFAESSGGGRSLMFPNAWRFRDYVIESFNKDKPFDQFVREQIAGDLLPFDSHQQKIEQIVATGMLALGPTNYEQQDKQLLRMEVIDEQVDTIGRAFLGLTLGCARCHDHKFDPIPMTDYYAMAGIFKSTQSLVDGNVSKYVERPLSTEKELAEMKAYREKVQALSKSLGKAKENLAKAGGASSTPNGLKNLSSDQLQGIVVDDQAAQKTGNWKESTSVAHFVDGHYLHDGDMNKGKKQITFTPKITTGGQYEVRVAYSAGGNRASNVPVTVNHQDGQSTVIINQSESPPIDGLFVAIGTFRFEADNVASVTISNEQTDGHVIADCVQFLPRPVAGKNGQNANDDRAASRAEILAAYRAKQATTVEPDKIRKLKQRVAKLDQQLKALKKAAPRQTAYAMSVKDIAEPKDGHLHIRGSVRNLGPVVSRGFISVCCEGSPQPNLQSGESGRMQLAEWIADPDHPLTARVYVNRVWRHLFGAGLVPTVDNFGMMGQRPSHPALLDYLADQFVKNDWSTKWLIREIMTSHVYRLSSQTTPNGIANDDQNRLLWRANRRRLDAEVLRDSLLAVSGKLDLTPGGLTIRKLKQYDLGYQFDTIRRSVYVPAFRNSMLDMFEVFDFANPNLVIGDRTTSTLPTQALFMMNNPMVINQSKEFAARLLAIESLTDDQRIETAFRMAIGRRPTQNEKANATTYLATFEDDSNVGESRLKAWSSFCHALFSSLEFRYID